MNVTVEADSAPSEDGRADVLIIGSGIMGSLVARALLERRPDLDVLFVEAGPDLTPGSPGANLKDVRDLRLREALQIRSQGPDQFSYGVDAATERARTVVTDGSLAELVRAGTFLASRAGNDSSDMPALAMSTNVGGMGAHWTCACPAPGAAEISPDVPREEWDSAWDEAARYLAVSTSGFPASPIGDWVLGRTGALVPGAGRPVQRMPMSRDRSRRWGSPALVLRGASYRLRSETLCTQVLLDDDGVARGARLRDLRDGAETTVQASIVVIACDSLRTPQLLHASGIRPGALGRHLNEHARILSRVPLAGSDAAGLPAADDPFDPADPMLDSFWMPYDPPAQPFHVQLSLIDPTLTAGRRAPSAAGMEVTLSTLVPTEVSAENRLEFSDHSTDAYGMPAFTVHFRRSSADLALIARAVEHQLAVQHRLNQSRPGDTPTPMPPGSSLHYTGTVRAGSADDGSSVCDTRGRVWGTSGLYVASNGVVPTALAHNVTPSGAGFAVRTAADISRRLP